MSDHESSDGSDCSDPSPSTSTSKRPRGAENAAEGSSRAGKRKMSEFDKGVRAEAARTKREVNRLAQQQARFRRQQYIIELETRLELLSRPEPERIKHLGSIIGAVIAENRQLRKLCQTLSGFLTEGLPSVLPRMGMTTELYDAIINRCEHEAAIDSFCANKKRLEEERLAALARESRPSTKKAASAASASTSASRTMPKAGPSFLAALTSAKSSSGPCPAAPAAAAQPPPPPPPPPTSIPWATMADDMSASPIDYVKAHNEAGGTSGSSSPFTTPFPAAMSADISFWSTPLDSSFSPSKAGRASEPVPSTVPAAVASAFTVPADLSRFQQVPLHGPPPPPPVQHGHWTTSSALEFLSSLPPGLAYGAPPPASPASRAWAPPPDFDYTTFHSPATTTTSSSHIDFFAQTTPHPPPPPPPLPDPRPFGH